MSSLTSARRSIFSEWRALLAVANKEWIIFRRYPGWVLGYFIWPVLFPLGFIFTAKALGGPDGSSLPAFSQLSGTTDYAGFIVVGSTIWMWVNMTLWSVGLHLRNEQMRGTLESNWLCPVPRISVMLGASLSRLGVSMMLLIVSVIEFRLFLGVQLVNAGSVLPLLFIILLLIPSVYGLSLTFASLVIRFKEANSMVYLVRGTFAIFCGVSYPLAVLPEWMRRVSVCLPVTYAVRSIRAVGLAGATYRDILPDLRMLAVFAVILPVMGYVAFCLAEQRARRTGDLGQY